MPTVAAGPLAKRVQSLRLKAKLTQEQLAIKAGLTISTVRKLEQGRSDPSWETARKLATALGVSLDKLAED